MSAQNRVAEAYRAMGMLHLSNIPSNLVALMLSLLACTGDMHSNGQGVEENLEEAFTCYEKAAELGECPIHRLQVCV